MPTTIQPFSQQITGKADTNFTNAGEAHYDLSFDGSNFTVSTKFYFGTTPLNLQTQFLAGMATYWNGFAVTSPTLGTFPLKVVTKAVSDPADADILMSQANPVGGGAAVDGAQILALRGLGIDYQGPQNKYADATGGTGLMSSMSSGTVQISYFASIVDAINNITHGNFSATSLRPVAGGNNVVNLPVGSNHFTATSGETIVGLPISGDATVDGSSGNVTVALPGATRLYSISQLGNATTISGIEYAGSSPKAINAKLSNVGAIFDPDGNIYDIQNGAWKFLADPGARTLNAVTGVVNRYLTGAPGSDKFYLSTNDSGVLGNGGVDSVVLPGSSASYNVQVIRLKCR